MIIPRRAPQRFSCVKSVFFHMCMLVTTRWHTREHSDPWDVAFQVMGNGAQRREGKY